MAKWAVCPSFNSAMDTNDVTTLNLETAFFNTDGEDLVTEVGTVACTIDPTQTEALWHQAMVTAIVAYASTAFGWTLPRTSVIHLTLTKGLIL